MEKIFLFLSNLMTLLTPSVKTIIIIFLLVHTTFDITNSLFYSTEIEKLHLQELELSKGLVEEQASAKLAELNHRQRKEELEQKSRQIRQERHDLSATFEAAKQRTSELVQQPSPGSKRISLTSELSYHVESKPREDDMKDR